MFQAVPGGTVVSAAVVEALRTKMVGPAAILAGVARLAVPQQVYGVVLPAGTSLHLHRAHPRSRAHWVGTVLIAPLHLLILALLALCWRRRPAPRAPALRAMAYLRDDATVLGRTWPAGTVIRFSVGGRVDIGPAR